MAAHCSTPLRGACDQLAHFLVGGLREVFVKLPDCLEIFRRDRAEWLEEFGRLLEVNLGPAEVVM